MAATMSTSTPTYATLLIRFVTNPNTPSTDDWVRVNPIHSANATAISQDYKMSARLGGHRHVSKVTGGYNLVNYVTNILRLVSADDKPCKQVQFDIPSVPSILVDHDRIRNRIPEIADLMRQIVESWPQVGTELPVAEPAFPFANINWNSTATPWRPSPLSIPAPPYSWNSPSFRTPARVNRHMYFDDAGNEIIDLTLESDTDSVYDESQD